MRIRKLIYALCTITSAISLIGYSENRQILTVANQTATSQPNQNLIDALTTIGAPLGEVLAFQQSGQVTPGIVKATSVYANDSSNLIFNNLSQTQSNALVLFCFGLNNEKKLSDQSLQDLMKAEKLRAGMSNTQIEKLNSLTKKLIDNSSYELTPAMVNGIKELMPFISANPFAFADTIGPIIGALIYNSENGTIIPDPELEQGLTDASQQLTGLSDAQIENVTNITNTYQSSNTFDPSDDNVNDMNQALAVAALPLGAYALYPLLGYETVTEVNNVTGAYGYYFNQGAVDHWNNVATRQGYYNDAVNNHQGNVNQREGNRQSDANAASQNHQGNVDQREGNRQSDAGTASQNRQSDVSGRQSDASAASQNRQGNVSQRQSNVSGAEGRTNLNRDNARAGSRGGYGGGDRDGDRGGGGGRR